jgi:hypothetical protein
MVFGPDPTVTLAKARQLRETAARALLDGIDPSVAKRQRAAEQTALVGSTFETIARDWHESQKMLWSKRHAALVMSSFEGDVFPRTASCPSQRSRRHLLWRSSSQSRREARSRRHTACASGSRRSLPGRLGRGSPRPIPLQ